MVTLAGDTLLWWVNGLPSIIGLVPATVLHLQERASPRTSLPRELLSFGLPYSEIKIFTGITQNTWRLTCGV